MILLSDRIIHPVYLSFDITNVEQWVFVVFLFCLKLQFDGKLKMSSKAKFNDFSKC